MCVARSYASLYQHPPGGKRTSEEDQAFRRALKVMADVYASAVGTTVLQIKEIPPRPAEFDGALCLFDLREGVNEKAIRAALDRFGTIKSCELGSRTPTIVRFSEHAAAMAAKDAATMGDHDLSTICGGIDTLYNERPYEDRGWCCFEEGVAMVVVAYLAMHPSLYTDVEAFRKKLIVLGSDGVGQPHAAELSPSKLLATVQKRVENVKETFFTGENDRKVVLRLLCEFTWMVSRGVEQAVEQAVA